jgi:hypothetical protein
MAYDEAPAATIGDLDEKRDDPSEASRPDAGQFRMHGPISVVAAEIHLGKASGHRLRRLARLKLFKSYASAR